MGILITSIQIRIMAMVWEVLVVVSVSSVYTNIIQTKKASPYQARLFLLL